MNEQGQFLLYDAILSIIIIFIVIIAMFYIINQETEQIPQNNEALERLNIISSYEINNQNILINIENNDSESKEFVEKILSDKNYLLQDLTLNKTILSKYSSNYKNSISSKKVIGEHEFRLTFYS